MELGFLENVEMYILLNCNLWNFIWWNPASHTIIEESDGWLYCQLHWVSDSKPFLSINEVYWQFIIIVLIVVWVTKCALWRRVLQYAQTLPHFINP